MVWDRRANYSPGQDSAFSRYERRAWSLQLRPFASDFVQDFEILDVALRIATSTTDVVNQLGFGHVGHPNKLIRITSFGAMVAASKDLLRTALWAFTFLHCSGLMFAWSQAKSRLGIEFPVWSASCS